MKPKVKIFRFVSVFRTYIETTKTNRTVSKQAETTLYFLKKYPNMLSIKLFRLLFCLFQFNQNPKTFCFSIKATRNKRFVLDSSKTSFGSSFGCFESKLVSKESKLVSKESKLVSKDTLAPLITGILIYFNALLSLSSFRVLSSPPLPHAHTSVNRWPVLRWLMTTSPFILLLRYFFMDARRSISRSIYTYMN